MVYGIAFAIVGYSLFGLNPWGETPTRAEAAFGLVFMGALFWGFSNFFDYLALRSAPHRIMLRLASKGYEVTLRDGKIVSVEKAEKET